MNVLCDPKCINVGQGDLICEGAMLSKMYLCTQNFM